MRESNLEINYVYNDQIQSWTWRLQTNDGSLLIPDDGIHSLNFNSEEDAINAMNKLKGK